MTKRLLTAATGIALALIAGSADARSYYGHRGDRSSSGSHRHGASGSASTSRSCLTPAAQALLGRIEAQFGRVQIVSTCRPGATIAGTGHRSKHATGEAIDFQVPGGKKAEVVRWLMANHKSGGTMTYRDMGHVHVDVGQHFVSLGAPSGGRRG
jgi:hypothetical protein